MSSFSDPERRLLVGQGIAYEVLDGEAVVLHLPSGTYFRMNPVATTVWESIIATGSLGGARERVLEEFEVDAKTLEPALDHLVRDLLRLGLLSEAAGDSLSP